MHEIADNGFVGLKQFDWLSSQISAFSLMYPYAQQLLFFGPLLRSGA